MRPGSTAPAVSSASSRTTVIRWPTRIVPLRIRPTAIRPTYSFARQVRDQELERVARSRTAGGGVTSTSRSSSGRRSVPGTARSRRRRARLRVRVHDRELDLVLVRAEVHEQLVDVVEHLGRAGVGAVDLVERDDDRQPAGHRLLEDVARLRAAGPPPRRRAAGRSRPSAGRARPRRRSPRGRACRRCSAGRRRRRSSSAWRGS